MIYKICIKDTSGIGSGDVWLVHPQGCDESEDKATGYGSLQAAQEAIAWVIEQCPVSFLRFEIYACYAYEDKKLIITRSVEKAA